MLTLVTVLDYNAGMTTQKYALFIKELREKRGYSQSEMARRLEMSRPKYITIENGEAELKLSDAEKLVDILGVDMAELQSGTIPDYEKYKQMILAYLRNTPDIREGVPKTKLAKLLYLADFAWYYNTAHSMSGMQYKKFQYGPVPEVYFRSIDEMFDSGQIEIKQTPEGAMLISQTDIGKNAELKDLKKGELELIKKIAHKWKGKRTQEIVAFTHAQLPYKLCRDNEIIPYELIIQEDPESVY